MNPTDSFRGRMTPARLRARHGLLPMLFLIALTVAGIARADIPGRAIPGGAVPNPGTQQQELANLTFPGPYNVFEFTVTCGACHAGSVDQQAAHMGNWAGGSMASAARDPVFRANQILVNDTLKNLTGQDGAGNMCFRCHSPNGWYSGRFDPTKAGDAQGKTMLHSIVASTDDEGVMCETCHRAIGNVSYKRKDLIDVNPVEKVWNMIAGIFGWEHDGGPYVDQVGDPTIAEGSPYGDTTLQFLDGMTYVGPYSGGSDVYFSDLPIDGTPYTGQNYGIYPPNWTGPMNPVPAGMPAQNSAGQDIAYNADGSIPPAFEAPIGQPIDPITGQIDYRAQALSIEHPTVGAGPRKTSESATGLLPMLPDGPGKSQSGGRMPSANEFIRTSEHCGSCHDLTVPVLNHGMPEQRTYTEWKFSDFSKDTHVGFDPIRQQARAPGKERCQDCHMPKLKHEYADNDPSSYNADPLIVGGFPYGKDRGMDGGTTFHKLTGANRDLPDMMKALYPEVDLEVIGMPTGSDPRIFPGMLSNRDSMYDRAKRNTEITLRDGLDVKISQPPTPVMDNADPLNPVPLTDANGNPVYEMKVKVTNESGHRIPSGYPDGRRFWIEVTVNDGATRVYESGYYDPDQAGLFNDASRTGFNRALTNVIDATDPANNAVMVYERLTGNCAASGCVPSNSLVASPSLLNNTILFDNRIPPKGFSYADYRKAGVKFWKYDPTTYMPVEDAVVDPATGAISQQRYPDGRNWDEVTYRFAAPAGATLTAQAEVYWQTHSRDFMEHLKNLDVSTVRPEGPPSILAPNYPRTPTYLSDVIGLGGMTDLDGKPLRDNWGGIAYAAWLKTGMGAPYLVDRDDTTSVAPTTAPAVTVASYSYPSPLNGLMMTEPYTVDIDWTEVPEADGYVVWIRYGKSDATADWDRLAVTDKNSLTLRNTAMNVGKSYGFKVEAFNGKGSIMSAPVSFATPNNAPRAPQNLSVVGMTPGSVNLSWHDAADNETKFEIWRFDVPVNSLVPQASFVVATQTPGPNGYGGNTFTDTSVMPGQCYNYQVRAYNADGIFSTWNTPAPVEACVPAGTVTLTSVTAPSDSQVDLAWSTTYPQATVGGFRIERGDTVNGPWNGIAVAANTATGLSDASVLASTTYFYRIVVVGTANNDLLTSAVASVTTPAPPPPSAPTGLSADATSAGGMQVALTWTDNAANETGYVVERATGAGAWTPISASLPPGSGPMSYVDTTVSANTTYTYRVQAVNAGGATASNTVTLTTPDAAVVVLAPTNLTALIASASQVNLAWRNAANNATGFVIERSTNGGAFVTLKTLKGVKTTSYQDRSAKLNNIYVYRVRAIRLASGVTTYSDPSNGVEVSMTAPAAPTGLTATAALAGGTATVTLQWNNSAANAATLTIQRSANNGGTWRNVTTSLKPVGATGSYTQTRVGRGTTYLYRIRAANPIGVSAWADPPATVTTP